MPVCHHSFAGTGDGDVDRLGDLPVPPNGDQRRRVEGRKRLCCNAITRNTALAQPPVAAAHGLGLHPGLFADTDPRSTRGRRGAVVQSAQPPQRGEPPELVAAVRNLEGVHVERREQLPLVQCGK